MAMRGREHENAFEGADKTIWSFTEFTHQRVFLYAYTVLSCIALEHRLCVSLDEQLAQRRPEFVKNRAGCDWPGRRVRYWRCAACSDGCWSGGDGDDAWAWGKAGLEAHALFGTLVGNDLPYEQPPPAAAGEQLEPCWVHMQTWLLADWMPAADK